MRWEIKDKVACEFWTFTGISFAGTKRITRVHAYGGLQGDDFPGDEVKSLGIIAEPGIRVIFMTANNEDGWENLPWRCFQVIEGKTTKLKDGRTAIQVPDLDAYSEPDTNRADLECQSSYPHVNSLSEGTTWTFGRVGRRQLKCNIRAIRIEKIPESTE